MITSLMLPMTNVQTDCLTEIFEVQGMGETTTRPIRPYIRSTMSTQRLWRVTTIGEYMISLFADSSHVAAMTQRA